MNTYLMNWSQDNRPIPCSATCSLGQLAKANFPMPSSNMERFIHTDHVRYDPDFLSTEATLLTVKAQVLNALVKQKLSRTMNQNKGQQLPHNTAWLVLPSTKSGCFQSQARSTQFKIFDMSVSNNKERTHAWCTPLIYSRKQVQQGLYMEVKGS